MKSKSLADESRQLININYLPPELLLYIFKRLNLQDLLYCKLVSKNWNYLASEEAFDQFPLLRKPITREIEIDLSLDETISFNELFVQNKNESIVFLVSEFELIAEQPEELNSSNSVFLLLGGFSNIKKKNFLTVIDVITKKQVMMFFFSQNGTFFSNREQSFSPFCHHEGHLFIFKNNETFLSETKIVFGMVNVKNRQVTSHQLNQEDQRNLREGSLLRVGNFEFHRDKNNQPFLICFSKTVERVSFSVIESKKYIAFSLLDGKVLTEVIGEIACIDWFKEKIYIIAEEKRENTEKSRKKTKYLQKKSLKSGANVASSSVDFQFSMPITLVKLFYGINPACLIVIGVEEHSDFIKKPFVKIFNEETGETLYYYVRDKIDWWNVQGFNGILIKQELIVVFDYFVPQKHSSFKDTSDCKTEYHMVDAWKIDLKKNSLFSHQFPKHLSISEDFSNNNWKIEKGLLFIKLQNESKKDNIDERSIEEIHHIYSFHPFKKIYEDKGNLLTPYLNPTRKECLLASCHPKKKYTLKDFSKVPFLVTKENQNCTKKPKLNEEELCCKSKNRDEKNKHF